MNKRQAPDIFKQDWTRELAESILLKYKPYSWGHKDVGLEVRVKNYHKSKYNGGYYNPKNSLSAIRQAMRTLHNHYYNPDSKKEGKNISRKLPEYNPSYGWARFLKECILFEYPKSNMWSSCTLESSITNRIESLKNSPGIAHFKSKGFGVSNSNIREQIGNIHKEFGINPSNSLMPKDRQSIQGTDPQDTQSTKGNNMNLVKITANGNTSNVNIEQELNYVVNRDALTITRIPQACCGEEDSPTTTIFSATIEGATEKLLQEVVSEITSGYSVDIDARVQKLLDMPIENFSVRGGTINLNKSYLTTLAKLTQKRKDTLVSLINKYIMVNTPITEEDLSSLDKAHAVHVAYLDIAKSSTKNMEEVLLSRTYRTAYKISDFRNQVEVDVYTPHVRMAILVEAFSESGEWKTEEE